MPAPRSPLQLPLYTPEMAQRYAGGGGGLPPHIFATAGAAHAAMLRSGRPQSLVISGESGAGKTETTKFALQFLAGLAGGTGVEARVLAATPLLEAFGNAATLRNANSSRFGKLVHLFFGGRAGLAGARVQTYLLEKSRVAGQPPGERNYHAFYQMCAGLSEREAADYLVPPDAPGCFRYLRGGDGPAAAGPGAGARDASARDAAEFAQLRGAMAAVGLRDADQEQVFCLLSAVLWLGNVSFRAGAGGCAAALPDDALRNAACLLGVPQAELAAALASRSITAGGGGGGETIALGLSCGEAGDNRDALAKALYAALFGWLVARVNEALEGPEAGAPAAAPAAPSGRISILDIYGFECLPANGFEQLCINWANERLQQLFNRHLFKLEQAAYEAEGVDWQHVPFEDNLAAVELLEGRQPPGLVALLDEECLFPQGTDASLGAKLRATLGGRPRFAFDPRTPATAFALQHYAGSVGYGTQGLLHKNRDALSADLVALLGGSEEPLVACLAGGLAAAEHRRGRSTVAGRFREQLRELVARLEESELHFVRCVKPSARGAAAAFEPPLVLHQLRCSGVLEVARIARAGYPSRVPHAEFAARFAPLLPGGGPPGAELLEAAQQAARLLAHCGADAGAFQLGRTRVFLRAGLLGLLEDARARRLRAATVIQSTWRMLPHRRAFRRLRAAAVRTQARVRGAQARRRLQRQAAAAAAVQAAWRGRRARRRLLQLRAAALALQRHFRRRRLRRALGQEAARLTAAKAATSPQAGARQRFSPSPDARRRSREGSLCVGSEPWRPPPVTPVSAGVCASPGSGGSRHARGHAPGCASPGGGDSASGELLSAAAYHQIELWEDYANRLEEQLAQALAEGAGLRAALAEARRTIAEAPLSAEWGEVWAHAAEKRARAGASGASSPISGELERIPAAFAGRGAAAAAGEYARALGGELERKAALFADDAAFILEVRQGRSPAPGMDPAAELRTLKGRFHAFKADFKVRLGAATEIMRRLEQQERRLVRERLQPAAADGGAGPPLAPAAAEQQRRTRNTVGQMLKAFMKPARA